jgi:Glycosyl transferase family 2
LTSPAVDTTTPERAGEVLLSVCIPCYQPEIELIAAAAESAASQLPERSELLIAPSGPAAEVVDRIPLPGGARIVVADGSLDLVQNWNRCLTLSQGSLVHLLHADDLVAPGFYSTILDLVARFPGAALYATGFRPIGSRHQGADEEPVLLRGADAARFFLVDERHSCGNVVLTRRVIEECGLFDPAYASCPDEEAYLRFATQGGLAFSPKPLYLDRTHGGQERFSAWKSADFVPTFYAARVGGARLFGSESEAVAVASTERRTISVAVSLAMGGEREAAERVLEELIRVSPATVRSARLHAARVACRSSLLLKLLALRRVVKERLWLKRVAG